MSKLFMSFFVVAFFISCNTEVEQEPANDTITISGQLENAGNSALRATGLVEMVRDSTDEEGHFHIRFSYHQPEYFTLNVAGQSITLFLAPGDSIYIVADKDNFKETFTVSGDKANEAQYLFQKAQLEAEYQLSDFAYIYRLDEKAYFENIQNAESAINLLIKDLSTRENIDPAFQLLETDYPKYRFPVLHNQYPIYYRWLNPIADEDSVEFPIDYWKKRIADLPSDLVSHLTLPAYREILSSQAQFKIDQIIEEDTTLQKYSLSSLMYAADKAADQIFHEPEINEWYRFRLLHLYSDLTGPGDIDPYFEALIASTNNAFYKEKLEHAMAKWAHVAPGQEVPDFTFTDIDSNSVQLSDLKGRLIYLDVWATWCGPCLAEHPYWDELYEEYADSEIAFLTVSIDGSRVPWERMVKDKDMKGIHWFAEGNWQSELAKHFIIEGIPRFILIDQHGKVIKASAERPSGAIREVLDAHLAEI